MVSTTKRSLITAMLSLFVCLALLAGTTFAWFTDEVINSNNIIKTGKLEISATYSDNLDDFANGTAKDLENAGSNVGGEGVFYYQNWEPGYTDYTYINLKNTGTLAFKYQLNIVPTSKPGASAIDLADVIDVYIGVIGENGFNGIPTGSSFSESFTGMVKLGTLSELIEDGNGAVRGVLLPDADLIDGNKVDDSLAATINTYGDKTELTACVMLHMQETAGNDYQEKSVGGSFNLQLLASQFTYEQDSFNNTYDTDAAYLNLPVANVSAIEEEVIVNVGGTDYPLETAYVFAATEDEIAVEDSPYRYWIADFVVSLDIDAAEGSIGLAGNYGGWGWLAFTNDTFDVEKNYEYRLLRDATGGAISINYEELCTIVEEFKCGAFALNDTLAGATLTVKLCLFETEEPSPENGNSTNVETGNSYTIGTYTYTFE